MQKASFIIDQHGCAKNTVDAEILAAHLVQAGYTFLADEDEEIDLIIINSCGFIESAKQESIDAVMNARKRHPQAKILLAGCLAERYALQLRGIMDEADGIFGNGDLSRIAEAAERTLHGERPVIIPPQRGVCTAERNAACMAHFMHRGAAYVKLTEGCDNRCAFCAIPLIRGALRSRLAADVMTEIKSLIGQGVYEINLIGQDVASYPHLAELLGMINALEGIFIVRLLYMHPDHLCGGLLHSILQAMQKDSRIVPYFDIPFQSGSDRIIHAMGRQGTAAQYINMVRDIRSAMPQAAIRTTFMAGFPGEDDEAAKETVRFLREIMPTWSGCFIYSREEGTAAYSMKGRVPKKIAASRMNDIIAAQEEITRDALNARLGQEYDVLIEEIIPAPNTDEDGSTGETDCEDTIAIGRAWFQAPEVDGAVVVQYEAGDALSRGIQEGSIVRVHFDSVNGVDIAGHLV